MILHRTSKTGDGALNLGALNLVQPRPKGNQFRLALLQLPDSIFQLRNSKLVLRFTLRLSLILGLPQQGSQELWIEPRLASLL